MPGWNAGFWHRYEIEQRLAGAETLNRYKTVTVNYSPSYLFGE